ncbi:MAG TPA: LysR family transcriptional regulator, partial [Reyranella sp.]|nr:LysR family transcriptional regulator [Reyranella sp.]
MDANWDDLRVFLTLAREGTLSTAAKALGVSHPTVSRRVQALEQQIGARLFERLPDRFVPTSAGEDLADQPAQQAQAGDAQADGQQADGDGSGNAPAYAAGKDEKTRFD